MATKLQETLNANGGNFKPIKDKIEAAAKRVLELQGERDQINAEIAEERAAIKALGISKKAFDFGLKRKQMDEEQRDQLDENYSVVCDALNVPLRFEQGQLFEQPQLKEDENAEEEKSIGEQQAEAILNAAE